MFWRKNLDFVNKQLIFVNKQKFFLKNKIPIFFINVIFLARKLKFGAILLKLMIKIRVRSQDNFRNFSKLIQKLFW